MPLPSCLFHQSIALFKSVIGPLRWFHLCCNTYSHRGDSPRAWGLRVMVHCRHERLGIHIIAAVLLPACDPQHATTLRCYHPQRTDSSTVPPTCLSHCEAVSCLCHSLQLLECMERSSVCSGHVAICPRVNFNALPLCNEQWHLDDRPCLQRGRLAAARGCVALHSGVCVDHLQLDCIGQID